MDIEIYLTVVQEKENKYSTITLKNGDVLEGVYVGLRAPGGLLMEIRPTGKTREQYENVGISDPNPNIAGGDTLEVKNLGIDISNIESIRFSD